MCRITVLGGKGCGVELPKYWREPPMGSGMLSVRRLKEV